MIPPFAANGLLPPLPNEAAYACTRDEILKRFVDAPNVPRWRAELFRSWDLVRAVTADVAPSTVWWLWGCAVSEHPEPVFGDHEVLDALAILPLTELAQDDVRAAMIVGFLQAAPERHRVDVRIVYEFERDHPDYVPFTVGALEGKYRPQASRGIADHRTKVLVDAGFLEVRP